MLRVQVICWCDQPHDSSPPTVPLLASISRCLLRMINCRSIQESLLFSIQSGTSSDRISVCSAVSTCSLLLTTPEILQG